MDCAILRCSECNFRYSIGKESIGLTGRKVKCGNCGNIWHQNPIVDSDKELEQLNRYIDSFSKKSNPINNSMFSEEEMKVPDVIKEEKLSFWLSKGPLMLSFLIFLSSLILYSDFWDNYIGGLYSGLGIYNTDGVGISDMNVVTRLRNNKIDVVLTGNIYNESVEERTMPQLRAIAYNNSGDVVARLVSKKNDETIYPGGKLQMNRRLPQLPKSAKKLIIDIGNPLELKLR